MTFLEQIIFIAAILAAFVSVVFSGILIFAFDFYRKGTTVEETAESYAARHKGRANRKSVVSENRGPNLHNLD